MFKQRQMVYMFKKDIWCICLRKTRGVYVTERHMVYMFKIDMVYMCEHRHMVYMFKKDSMVYMFKNSYHGVYV